METLTSKLAKALEDLLPTDDTKWDDDRLENATCRFCGRTFVDSLEEVPQLCPSDDCPAYKAREVLATYKEIHS